MKNRTLNEEFAENAKAREELKLAILRTPLIQFLDRLMTRIELWLTK